MSELSFNAPTEGMGKRVYDLALELVAVPSITGSKDGEKNCARFIYDWISRVAYFKEHPGDLTFVDAANDALGRVSVAALLRAPRPAKKTVILMGHFDVVDTDVCGPLRPWAFDPKEYTRRVGEFSASLPEDARKDLESGNYIFGHGLADMKMGLALEMCLLEEYSRSPALDFNVLFLAVPDEEGDSVGMRGAVPFLAGLRERENDGLEFMACIDAEPAFITSGGAERAVSPCVYYGTIGKIMPLYMCVGRASHVGDYYEGLNSTLVASYLNIALEGAKETAESKGSQTFPPQSCLRMRDMRDRYAVTLPERTVLYYNCLTAEKTPAEVLDDMKKRAERAMSDALAHVGRTDLTPRVLTVEDVLARASEAAGGRDKLFAELLPEVSAEDERERSIEFLSRALDITGEAGPLVVVGFVPPFYPPRVNRGLSAGERAVRRAASDAAESLGRAGISFKEMEIFQGITDLSFTGFQGEAKDLAPLAANIPLWGRGYGISLDELRKIDIPCVLMGPIGKDCHKISERLELNYSFNVLPRVMMEYIEAVNKYFL